MAVATDDLLAKNGGEIDPALFPTDGPSGLAVKLAAWVSEGEGKTADLTGDAADQAVRDWAYHRAFKAVWVRLSSRPASKELPDQVSTAYTDGQIANFKTLADDHLAAFVAAVPTTGPGESLPLRTSSTTTEFTW